MMKRIRNLILNVNIEQIQTMSNVHISPFLVFACRPIIGMKHHVELVRMVRNVRLEVRMVG
jgi:hypothetical protein